MNIASTIWLFLKEKGLNDYAIAGIMGNLYAESALNPTNLQQSYEKKLGYTDESYTKAVDNGSYDDFAKDSAGYGLAQWTYHTRKAALLEYARSKGKSISDLAMQLEFMWQEMQGYKYMMSVLKEATSILEASTAVLTQYERPADMSETVQRKRATYGQKYYDEFTGGYCVQISRHTSLAAAEKRLEEVRAAGYPEAYIAVGGVAITPTEKEPVKEETPVGKYDPAKLIAIAMEEVGYLEKKSNSQLDSDTANAGDKNYTKYARDLDAITFYNGRKNGFAWCDVFVDWCFVQAFGKEAALALTFQPTKAADNCGAGCKYSRGYYKNKGRLFNTPQPGDQIFFYSSDKSTVSHTGLVYAVDKTYVYTVEGNTSSASGVVANGGAVATKKYKLNYDRLAGYGRPLYDVLYSKEYTIYIVKKDDTLWGIAQKFFGNGNEWNKIAELNGISGSVIHEGDSLKIPC